MQISSTRVGGHSSRVLCAGFYSAFVGQGLVGIVDQKKENPWRKHNLAALINLCPDPGRKQGGLPKARGCVADDCCKLPTQLLTLAMWLSCASASACVCLGLGLDLTSGQGPLTTGIQIAQLLPSSWHVLLAVVSWIDSYTNFDLLPAVHTRETDTELPNWRSMGSVPGLLLLPKARPSFGAKSS